MNISSGRRFYDDDLDVQGSDGLGPYPTKTDEVLIDIRDFVPSGDEGFLIGLKIITTLLFIAGILLFLLASVGF